MGRLEPITRHLRPEDDPRALRAAIAIAVVVLVGIGGYMWTEGWTFWRSLYFTLITLTTVGYGDYGLSALGERFTSLLLIGGIGVVTYSAGQVLPALFDRQLMRERSMNRKIEKLGDHYIVCGLGRIGLAVCERLAAGGMPLVAVDASQTAVDRAVAQGHLAVIGDATDDRVLLQLGLTRARGIACLTSSDTENIVITLSARELRPDVHIVSRAEEEATGQKIAKAGASRVISPIRVGGLRIADTILNPGVTESLVESANGGQPIYLAEITVHEGARLDGMTAEDYGREQLSLVFVGVRRGDGAVKLHPDPQEKLGGGDLLVVAGDADTIAFMRHDAAPAARAAA